MTTRANPRKNDERTGRSSREDRTGAVFGAMMTVVGIALAIVTALGLNDLASGHVDFAISLLAIVVVARWLGTELLDRWLLGVARRSRQWWRNLVVSFFLVPSSLRSSPSEITNAIDTIVDAPRLAVVRTSAQVSVLALVLVFLTGGWQALGIVLALLGVAIPLYQRAGTRAAAFEVEYRERSARLSERQLELLAHSPELRALGAVDYGTREIGALSTAQHQVALRAIRSALGSSLVTEFIGGVSVGLVAMDVGFGLLDGHVSLLRALVCVLVTSEFFAHVRRYGVEFHRREALEEARGHLEVTSSEQFVPTDVLETFNLITVAHPEPLSISLRRGDRVAILGASGVGKTTLAHTLLGWRAAREGNVRRTSDAVAYVSADTSLVPGTVGENLRLGQVIDDATVVHLLNALGLGAERFTNLDSPVSADGEGFSSGERVRLLIARALLHQPGLLILDDVAGLLDESSRHAIGVELARHNDMAIIEISVDDTLFISAHTTVRLT